MYNALFYPDDHKGSTFNKHERQKDTAIPGQIDLAKINDMQLEYEYTSVNAFFISLQARQWKR